MKKSLLLFVAVFNMVFMSASFAQSGGQVEDMFKAKCGICHTIGGGRLVGPDLAKVRDRRSEEWLLSYIRSSQTKIKSGDPDAVALFEEYNQVIMPDPMISDVEIKSLLDYITENSGGGVGATTETVSIIENATLEDLAHGKRLFEGNVRFANGGPSCISCHNDLSDVFFSENSYATKNIATSFANLGETGVKVILENPPFPVMAKAFEGHKLESEEVRALLVFLKNAGANTSSAKMSAGYLVYGILGALALLVLYAALWNMRKSRSVNYNIYKRQTKSFN